MSSSGARTGCGDWTEALLDEAAGQDAPAEWAAHAPGCPPCRRDRDRLGELFREMERVGMPSGQVEEALMQRVREDLAVTAPDVSWISSVLTGAALAVVASFLAAARGEAGGEIPLAVALSAVAWTAAFSVVVHTLRHAKRGPWSALPLVVAVMAILVIPTPSEGDVCAACELLGMGLTAARAVFVTTGILVGVALTTIVGRLLSERLGRVERTAIAGGVVLAAIGPALYMACAPFSLGSLIGLLGGLVAGVALSAMRGLWQLERA